MILFGKFLNVILDSISSFNNLQYSEEVCYYKQQGKHCQCITFNYTSTDLVSFHCLWFPWRMLVDSLTFKLSSLAPLKGKKWKPKCPKKKSDQQNANQWRCVVTGNFQIVSDVLKIVKTKILKEKLLFLLYIPPFYFNTMIS